MVKNMITEEMILQAFKQYRKLIGRESATALQSNSAVTYSHFKAGFLVASFISLEANGFTETNWNGNVIEGVVSGEDLL